MVPEPTHSRGEDGEKLEEAWRIAMDLFLEWDEELPLAWKAFLQYPKPLPQLPQQVIDTYPAVSPPPLPELCPLDFEMRCWGSFKHDMDRWLDEQPDDEQRLAPPPCPASNFRDVLSSMLHMSGQIEGVCCAALGCYPDFMNRDRSCDSGRRMRLVGVMAMEIDAATLEIQVARLYSYMLLTDCYFGLVSCYTQTFACKRLPGLERCVWVSPPVLSDSGDALKACAFVASLSQSFSLGETPTLPELRVPTYCNFFFASSTGPRPFDRAPILARLRVLGKELSVANMDKLVEGLAWLDEIVGRMEQPSFFSHTRGRITAMGVYKGEFVLVKFRDLSNSRFKDTDSYLRKFLREVDVYMRLRELQGEVIPELLQYGFIRGAMVCFVVITDHGRAVRMKPWEQRFYNGPELWEHKSSMVKSCLRRVHALGVHFGGEPLWLKSDRGSEYILITMSHGFVDGDRAGMAKDIEFVNKVYPQP
ncbi:hypothetical protein SELMODRAFT_422409 [Selaginella moellendorffii]|uniref:Protein kinase domain-containing protein n=1 Tax=Selaginella moellendorffii TaxID=88036 RepID=D8SIA9_SELML|nr:hypothetical protein SELMODRAFT_422409 [Selaginella moellendorffii]